MYASANQQVVGWAWCRRPTSAFRIPTTSAATCGRAARRRRGVGRRPAAARRAPARASRRAGQPAAAAELGAGVLGAPTVQGLPIVKPPYGTIAPSIWIAARSSGRCRTGTRPTTIRNHPALQGPDHSAHRPAGERRHARDQDPGDRRRADRDDRRRPPARRDAARLRQGRPAQDAGAVLMPAGANRLADDLHAGTAGSTSWWRSPAGTRRGGTWRTRCPPRPRAETERRVAGVSALPGARADRPTLTRRPTRRRPRRRRRGRARCTRGRPSLRRRRRPPRAASCRRPR